jgi:hypothetical protein
VPAPFISRDDLSDYLGRNVSADDGALIAVDAACDTVRTVAEQDFNQAVSTITLDGTGTDALLLPQLPVNTAGTVVVSGGTVTDYVVDVNRGVLVRKVADPTVIDWDTDISPTAVRWPAGRQNVVVTYNHGYADADLPRDVRMVALSLASRLIVQGVATEERVGDVSMKYAGAAFDLSATEQAILRKYRR